MKIQYFIKDKLLFLSINLILFMIVAFIMKIVGTNWIIIYFTMCLWFLPLLSYLIIEGINFKKYFDDIHDILNNLENKYLLPEILTEVSFVEGSMFNEILRILGRDMHENIKFYKDMQYEYREYIETWVHEIKTPVASAKLIIENNNNLITDKIDQQIDRIDGYIEQALYYSRSNEVNKDYIIKEISIKEAVNNIIRKNSRDFISKKIKLDIGDIDKSVYSDSKWVEFIINQIISNSIKYSSKRESKVRLYTLTLKNSVALIIEDNGVGIDEKELNRVFEKGFTGENGRKFGKATGMGLYLCNKLCEKLGLGLTIESQKGKGTKVSLIFPISDLLFSL